MALRAGDTHTATITSPSRTQTLRFPDRTLARLWCERDYRARSHDTNAPVWEPRKGKRGEDRCTHHNITYSIRLVTQR